MGLFGESYLLFSIGTLKPIWQTLFPYCFGMTAEAEAAASAAAGVAGDDNDEYADDVFEGEGNYYTALMVPQVCDRFLLHSITYSVVLGVILGMLLLGYAASTLGRRNGSLLTACLMACGACGLTAASVYLADVENLDTQQRLLEAMVLSLFVFGVGVGGEYPLAASSASEKAMGQMTMQLQKELEQDERAFLQERQRGEQRKQRVISRRAGRLSETEWITGSVVPPAPSQLESIREEESSVSETKNDKNKNLSSPRAHEKNLVPIEAQMEQTGKTDETLLEQQQIKPTEQHRGRQVQLVFTMQGMGILFNSLTMTTLLLITGQTGQIGQKNNAAAHDDAANVQAALYNIESLLLIWRISYAIGAGILLFVFLTRCCCLEESKVWKDDKERRQLLARSHAQGRKLGKRPHAAQASKLATDTDTAANESQYHRLLELNSSSPGQQTSNLLARPSHTTSITTSSSSASDSDASESTESTSRGMSIPSAVGVGLPRVASMATVTAIPSNTAVLKGEHVADLQQERLHAQQQQSKDGKSRRQSVVTIPPENIRPVSSNSLEYLNYQQFHNSYNSYPLATASSVRPATPSGLSLNSSISSLSAPSGQSLDEDDMTIPGVPSIDKEDDLQSNSMYLLLRNYGVRLVGVSLCWLLWDGTYLQNISTGAF